MSQARRSESGRKRENREGDERQAGQVPPVFRIDLESKFIKLSTLFLDLNHYNSGFVWNKKPGIEGLNLFRK